jgi:hypothetical protein
MEIKIRYVYQGYVITMPRQEETYARFSISMLMKEIV